MYCCFQCVASAYVIAFACCCLYRLAYADASTIAYGLFMLLLMLLLMSVGYAFSHSVAYIVSYAVKYAVAYAIAYSVAYAFNPILHEGGTLCPPM